MDINRINNTLGKFDHYLLTHKCVVVSVSGGSDSDIIVHMVATYLRCHLPKIHFVFCDTGLEWEATRNHIEELKKTYNINIGTVRGMSVVTAVRTYGIPVISKYHTHAIRTFCNGYPSGEKKINTPREKAKGYTFSDKQRQLAFAAKERGIKVSTMCCDKSKKEPIHKYMKQVGADLMITGERKAEGGVRAITHQSCYEPGDGKYDKYMPLFYWDDETKEYYKQAEGIRYSDCYEVYGMKRTGCVGCPLSSRTHEDLKTMDKYAPNLKKACMAVFGESYRLMDEFDIRKTPILYEEQEEKHEKH